jgi:hypothetical protein
MSALRKVEGGRGGHPLYAGVCVRDIHEVVPAADAVAELVAPIAQAEV